MARLVLSLDGQVMAEYNMNKERYTIGPPPLTMISASTTLPSAAITRLIINILNDSFLEDLNSTNGNPTSTASSSRSMPCSMATW